MRHLGDYASRVPELLVVTICSMNICRSPAMAELLGSALRDTVPTVEFAVASAGCSDALMPGAPRCDLAQALAGVTHPSGSASAVNIDDLRDSAVILTAERSHCTVLAALDPDLAPRTFTLLQAARLASWVAGGERDLADAGAATDPTTTQDSGDRRDDLCGLSPDLPDDVADRIDWLVGELDAARAFGPRRAPLWPHLGVANVGPDDLPDPHVLGLELHGSVAAAIRAAVDEIAAAVTAVVRQ